MAFEIHESNSNKRHISHIVALVYKLIEHIRLKMEVRQRSWFERAVSGQDKMSECWSS